MSVQIFRGVTVSGKHIVDNADLFKRPVLDPIEIIVAREASARVLTGGFPPFVDDERAFFVAVDQVKRGVPAKEIVATFSRIAEIKHYANYDGLELRDPDKIYTGVPERTFSWKWIDPSSPLVDRVRIEKSGADRHQGERSIVYGDKEALIIYGSRDGGYGDKMTKFHEDRVPSDRMIRKAAELIEAVNKRNWKQATERYHDLTKMAGHLFYTSQTYTQFLTDVGSIILQKSESYIVELGMGRFTFPIGYSINEPPKMSPKSEPESNGHKPSYSDQYVNRIHAMRRVVVPNQHSVRSSSTPFVDYKGHHKLAHRAVR
jgi:hypothetical protein